MSLKPKLFFSILLLSVLTFSCDLEVKENTSNDNLACKNTWEEIQEKEILTVLAENSPSSYFLYKGKNMGFEYELLHEFAKDMDIRINVKMMHDLDSMQTKLNNCEGDIIACNLTITPERLNEYSFTIPIHTTQQVLIQRKPDNWRRMSRSQLKDSMVTDIEQLRNKRVFVWKNSTYYQNIERINNSLNLNIQIIPADGDISSEELIRMISEKEIDFTITDANVAKINSNYFRNIDYSLNLSDEQEIAFACRKSSTTLIDTLNYWFKHRSNQSTIGEVKRKYFDRKNLANKAIQDYSSVLKEGQLSPYDEIIKIESTKINWDWRLISAIIFQESKFETWKVSWCGAYGLFQFMPATAKSYGINRSSSAQNQLKAGFTKLNKNYKQWLKVVPDSTEARYFTIATFNAGRAHIDDARRLAEKYGLNPNVWYDNVNIMVLNLSSPKYNRDKVVKYGYMRGIETYEYIYEIMERYEEYKHAFPDL
jgi:membrane-bound lytic murein transglycosylase F